MRIAVHKRVKRKGTRLVVSLSGGKDSVAVCLALTEAGIEHERLFADTEWEAPQTYEYLEMLRHRLGPIDVVRRPGGFARLVVERAGFPKRLGRYCTRDLKLYPMRDWYDAKDAEAKLERISVTGVRAEESAWRAKMTEWEDDDFMGRWMWRPIFQWTVQDVLAIHKRHNMPIHPLYRMGFDRIGCWPCVLADKNSIRLLAQLDPQRINEIRELERAVLAERIARNTETPGRYKHVEDATFFQSPNNRDRMWIDDVVAWANSPGRDWRPGADPTGGCFRWGTCETIR